MPLKVHTGSNFIAANRPLILNKTADYSVAAVDEGSVVMMGGSTARTITLPDITGAVATGFGVTICNGSTADVTIDANSTDTIDGSTTYTLKSGQSVWLVAVTSSSWKIELANNILEAGTGLSLSGNEMSLSDERFTSTLKSKLDGIATGAEVNVQSDWNATSGDAQILNKPTIPTARGAGDGLELDSNNLKVKKDGSTLAVSSSGVKVADDGIDTDQLADDAVDVDKLDIANSHSSGQVLGMDTASNSKKLKWIDPGDSGDIEGVTAGKGLTGGGTTGTVTLDLDLADNKGLEFSASGAAGKLQTKVTGAVQVNANGLDVKNNGIDSARIAGNAVTEAKLDVENSPSDGQVLSATSTGMRWVNQSSSSPVVTSFSGNHTADEDDEAATLMFTGTSGTDRTLTLPAIGPTVQEGYWLRVINANTGGADLTLDPTASGETINGQQTIKIKPGTSLYVQAVTASTYRALGPLYDERAHETRKLWMGSQSNYDGVSTKDDDTIYLVESYGDKSNKAINAATNTLTADEASADLIELSGGLTANRTVTVPTSIIGPRVFNNKTTGTYTVSVKQGTSAAVVIGAGLSILMFDGTKASAIDAGVSSVTGGTGISVSPSTGSVVVKAARPSVTTKTADYTIVAADELNTIRANKSTAITFTLPDVTGSVGTGYRVWVENVGAGDLTLDGNGSDTIDGETTQVLKQGDVALLQAMTATTWKMLVKPGGGGAGDWTKVFDGNVTVSSANSWSSELTATADLTGRKEIRFEVSLNNRGSVWGSPIFDATKWDDFTDVGSGSVAESDEGFACVGPRGDWYLTSSMMIGRGSAADKFRFGAYNAATDPMPLQVYVR